MFCSNLINGIVLAMVSKQSTYGYQIVRNIQDIINISESTLYPVLHRLDRAGYLTSYNKVIDGRNRCYYMITHQGHMKLLQLQHEWEKYREVIDLLLCEKE